MLNEHNFNSYNFTLNFHTYKYTSWNQKVFTSTIKCVLKCTSTHVLSLMPAGVGLILLLEAHSAIEGEECWKEAYCLLLHNLSLPLKLHKVCLWSTIASCIFYLTYFMENNIPLPLGLTLTCKINNIIIISSIAASIYAFYGKYSMRGHDKR